LVRSPVAAEEDWLLAESESQKRIPAGPVAPEEGTSGGEERGATASATDTAAANTTRTSPSAPAVLQPLPELLLEQPLQQVDFYRNPTLLSRLILNQKYHVAMSRLKRHPEEARIVVVALRKVSSVASSPPGTAATFVASTCLRQLPIHLACADLGRAVDPALRDALNQLITHLAVTFPEACGVPDHNRLRPVQHAVRCGAQPSTVSLLLMAVPESVHCADDRGRSLSQLNRACDSPHRRQVAQILKLDVEFWRQSREEANFRLQQQRQPPPEETDPAQARNPDPSGEGAGPGGGGGSSPPRSSRAIEPLRDESVTPVAWEQLEVRAVALEQILAEMNEKNYALNRRIEHLVKGKMDLLDHLDRIKQSSLAREAKRLQQQNRALRRQVAELEQLLRRSSSSSLDGRQSRSNTPQPEEEEQGADDGRAKSPPRRTARRSGSESSSLVGHSWSGAESASSASVAAPVAQAQSLQADNLKLIQAIDEQKHKYESLHRDYKSQQLKLNRLVSLIRRLSKDTVRLLLEGGSPEAAEEGGAVGAGSRGSRHSHKSHLSALSESPLTNSEASSISDLRGASRERAASHPSKDRSSKPLRDASSSSASFPRRRRTIEIQWQSASTGLAPSSGGRIRRRGIRHEEEEEEEEKVEEHEDEIDPLLDLSDNLSVLFAQAIEFEENLPHLPMPAARSIPAPSRGRAPAVARPEPPPGPPPPPPLSPARRIDPPQLQHPRSSPGGGTAASDLRIPALLLRSSTDEAAADDDDIDDGSAEIVLVSVGAEPGEASVGNVTPPVSL
jgi:hypothetical protein